MTGVCIRAPQCSLVIINVKIKPIGLNTGFLGFNTAEKKATLYDGGSVPFSATTLASIGEAVAAALSKPDKFKNSSIYINSTVTTQRSLLDLFEKHTGVKWTIEEKSTADIENETNAKLAQETSAPSGDSSTGVCGVKDTVESSRMLKRGIRS